MFDRGLSFQRFQVRPGPPKVSQRRISGNIGHGQTKTDSSSSVRSVGSGDSVVSGGGGGGGAGGGGGGGGGGSSSSSSSSGQICHSGGLTDNSLQIYTKTYTLLKLVFVEIISSTRYRFHQRSLSTLASTDN